MNTEYITLISLNYVEFLSNQASNKANQSELFCSIFSVTKQTKLSEREGYFELRVRYGDWRDGGDGILGGRMHTLFVILRKNAYFVILWYSRTVFSVQ